MKDHYYKLFQGLTSEPLPRERLNHIAREIALLERRVIFVRRISFASVFAVFFSVFVPSFNFLATQFSESSFISYASLLISDSDLTFLHSQEFIFSLIESLPMFGITITMTLVFLLLGAIRLVAVESRQATRFFTTHAA